MPADNPALNFVLQFLASCPSYLVWLIGGLVAVATWRKHPGVSGLVLAAVLWQVFLTFVSALAYTFVSRAINDTAIPGEQVPWLYRGMNLAFSIGYSIGYLLLLVAVFKWRGETGTAPPG